MAQVKGTDASSSGSAKGGVKTIAKAATKTVGTGRSSAVDGSNTQKAQSKVDNTAVKGSTSQAASKVYNTSGISSSANALLAKAQANAQQIKANADAKAVEAMKAANVSGAEQRAEKGAPTVGNSASDLLRNEVKKQMEGADANYQEQLKAARIRRAALNDNLALKDAKYYANTNGDDVRYDRVAQKNTAPVGGTAEIVAQGISAKNNMANDRLAATKRKTEAMQLSPVTSTGEQRALANDSYSADVQKKLADAAIANAARQTEKLKLANGDNTPVSDMEIFNALAKDVGINTARKYMGMDENGKQWQTFTSYSAPESGPWNYIGRQVKGGYGINDWRSTVPTSAAEQFLTDYNKPKLGDIVGQTQNAIKGVNDFVSGKDGLNNNPENAVPGMTREEAFEGAMGVYDDMAKKAATDWMLSKGGWTRNDMGSDAWNKAFEKAYNGFLNVYMGMDKDMMKDHIAAGSDQGEYGQKYISELQSRQDVAQQNMGDASKPYTPTGNPQTEEMQLMPMVNYAVDSGMGYEDLQALYDGIMQMLKQYYGDAFDYANSVALQTLEKALQEAYILRRMGERGLSEQLAAYGITGGATESRIARNWSDYYNNRNSANSNYADTVKSNAHDYQQGLQGASIDLQKQYASEVADFMKMAKQHEYDMELTKLRASLG